MELKIKEVSRLRRIYLASKFYFLLIFDPVIILIAILAYLYFLPRPDVPQYFETFSNPMGVVHFIEYFIFSFILGIALRHSKYFVLRKNNYLFAILAVIIIAVGVEMHQQIRMLPGEPILKLIKAGIKGFKIQLSELPMYLGIGFAQLLRWLLKREKRILNIIF